MKQLRAFTVSTMPITNSLPVPAIQAGAFTNGPLTESYYPRFSSPCLPPYLGFQPLGDHHAYSYSLDPFTTHSTQDNNFLLPDQLSASLPLDPSLVMDNQLYTQDSFLATPISAGSSPVSRRTQPCVDTSPLGVTRTGSANFSLMGASILPAQPHIESSIQQDILPVSRCSSISSGQALYEQVTNCRSKASSFQRKGRSGDVYTVCPKQTYECLFSNCKETKQKACDMREHYFSVHALFNCIQCPQCGNSYARPCTFKRHLRQDRSCPKARSEGLTQVQKEQSNLRNELRQCFTDMTNINMVKQGVKIIKKCNRRNDMRKRKRRPGGNTRACGVERILNTQELQESESVCDSSDYGDPDMDSGPETRVSELEGSLTGPVMLTSGDSGMDHSIFFSPYDQSAILSYGSNSPSTTLPQHSRPMTASHRNSPRNTQLPCIYQVYH